MIFDNHDFINNQKNFHLTSTPHTHEVFHLVELPESVIIYSSLNNVTTVLLDFQVERKPENYRLSVLKNLQDYDFRVIEDSSKTIFTLCIEYPEFNYPTILNSDIKVRKFLYDIKERSIDFQGAIQKMIPGIVLSKVIHPDIFGNTSNRSLQNQNSYDSFDPKAPQTENAENTMFTLDNEAESSEISEIDIIDDLKGVNNLTNHSTLKETSDKEILSEISTIFKVTEPEVNEEVDIEPKGDKQSASEKIRVVKSEVIKSNFHENASPLIIPEVVNKLSDAITEKNEKE